MIATMKKEMREILENNILSFWIEHMQDYEEGGFYGRMTGDGTLIKHAVKGGILNARILWTFSAAYRLLEKPVYLETAKRAKDYFLSHFYDNEYGGVYWALDYKGLPADTKKQVYNLGFALYGLSEYYRATGDKEVLGYAIHLFETVETYSFDTDNNGYFEAFTREWDVIEDMRLSEKDANEKKTMNTHLHILEAYTNLYRVWQDEKLEKQLRNLIDIFTDKIINKGTGHLDLFFDEEWNRKSTVVSYGHDIEASWLIYEASLVLNDGSLISKVGDTLPSIISAAGEGLTPEGGMIYEKHSDTPADGDFHWWVQAESVVGYLNMYQYFNDKGALKKASRCWEFIKTNLIDREKGEWYWSIRHNGMVNREDDKAGFWKCPYHNGRMCMEVMERFN